MAFQLRESRCASNASRRCLPGSHRGLEGEKDHAAFKSPAFAVYGQMFAGEQSRRRGGSCSTQRTEKCWASLLCRKPAGASKTSVFSVDGKWLAVSQGTRGSLWNLDNGARVFLAHGFDGALFENGQLITKFSKDAPTPSRVFQFDLNGNSNKKLFDITERGFYRHTFLAVGQPAGHHASRKEKQSLGEGHTMLEVRDVHNNNLLWERKLHQGLPKVFYTPTAITMLIWDWGAIKEAARITTNQRAAQPAGEQRYFLPAASP